MVFSVISFGKVDYIGVIFDNLSDCFWLTISWLISDDIKTIFVGLAGGLNNAGKV